MKGLFHSVCDGLNDFQLNIRDEDAGKLGVAGFMTEFGALPNTTAGVEVMSLTTGLMDKFGHGARSRVRPRARHAPSRPHAHPAQAGRTGTSPRESTWSPT